jgi:GT2 family glycosyltransferase
MSEKTPYISVVIPTYNRPRQIERSLESFIHLDYPRDRFEVIVVNDGGDEPVDGVISPFRDRFDIKLLEQANAGAANARNMGSRSAKGDLIAFTDDDCSPDPGWLKVLASYTAEKPDCIIGGRTINALPDNVFASTTQLLIDYLFDYHNADADRALFLIGNNIAVPAKLYHEVGGFNPAFTYSAAEDHELCDRWLDSGKRMVYAPEAIVYHFNDLTLRTFCRQHFNYGRGALCFYRTRAQRRAEPIRLESISLYLKLLLYPFSRKSGVGSLKLAATLIVSQGMHTAGFLVETLKRFTGPR